MQVDEGRVAARERQKRQEDIQLEVDTLRKGLIMQVSELLKERDCAVTSSLSGEC